MFERLPFEPATPAGVVTAVVHACQESRLRDLVPLAAALHGKPLGVVATTLAKQLVLCTADGLCMRRPPKALWKVLLVCFMLCSSWIYTLKSLSGRERTYMWRLYGLLVRFVAPCCGFRVANGVVGLIKPACFLEDWHRQALWREDRPKHWTKVDVPSCCGPAWSHCSLRLSSPNLMFVVLFGVSQDIGAVFVLLGCSLCLLCRNGWPPPSMSFTPLRCRPGGGWSMVLCYFVRIAVTVGGCGTRPCVKSILLSPSSLSVVLTLACAFLPWSSGKFALGDRMPMCRQAFPGSKVVVLVLLQGDGRQNIAGDSCRRKDLSIIFVFRMKPPPLMLHRLTDQVIFTPYMHFLFGCVLLLLACMVPLDLYAPCNSHLLATWCGTKHAVVDWQLLERKWSSGCGPAAIVPAIGFCPG